MPFVAFNILKYFLLNDAVETLLRLTRLLMLSHGCLVITSGVGGSNKRYFYNYYSHELLMIP